MKYFEFGQENPELMVMLHGGGVCYRGALPVAEEMAKTYHVVLVDKVAEETQELREAAVSGDAEAVAEELGDLLFAVVKVARFAGVDPEQAAHAACEKFIHRFAAMEAAAADSGVPLKQRTLAQMQPLWQQAKQTVSADNEGKKSARQ